MISSLRGPVLLAHADQLVVEVGGVGFSVAVTPEVGLAARVGREIFLHTSLIVREDALSLYGFAEREELELFGLLLGVSGVGPKSALGVLATLSRDQIAQAVAEEDDRPFRKVSGIGPKTAKLIAVQLAGRIVPPAPGSGSAAPVASDVTAQLVQALGGLGWQERIALDAAEQVVRDASEADRGSVPVLLRQALALLGRG